MKKSLILTGVGLAALAGGALGLSPEGDGHGPAAKPAAKPLPPKPVQKVPIRPSIFKSKLGRR
jgi:hypothetical protein